MKPLNRVALAPVLPVCSCLCSSSTVIGLSVVQNLGCFSRCNPNPPSSRQDSCPHPWKVRTALPPSECPQHLVTSLPERGAESCLVLSPALCLISPNTWKAEGERCRGGGQPKLYNRTLYPQTSAEDLAWWPSSCLPWAKPWFEPERKGLVST